VRLGSRSSNKFINILNEKNESIQKSYLPKMIDFTKM